MKKVTFAAFIAFCAGALTLVAIAQLASSDSVADEDSLRTITPEELAEHSTAESCWMAIEGKVYDFTSYVPNHPTPPAIMLDWCGKEATEGMRTKGYGRDHSPTAWAMMEEYLVGTLAAE